MDTDLDIIEKANKTNNDDNNIMFSAKANLSKNISEYELIKDIRNGMQLPKLEFQMNKELLDLIKNEEGEGLGGIEHSEADTAQKDHVIILDMKVKSATVANIKLSDDAQSPCITGCTFLPNGGVLLCDYWNKKVKLLDSVMSVKKSLKLSDNPHDIAAIGENEAIITFGKGNRNLQYLFTDPKLKLGKTVGWPGKCFGLHTVNNEIYTAYHKSSGHDEIWRQDMAGNIMRKVVLTQRRSFATNHLRVCLAGSIPRVYLTDWDNSRVTCFQLDGKMVFKYQDKQLSTPLGIYVDSAGNSLVCGTDSNNVVVITADGRKHGELLTSKDTRNPKCIDYRPEDNTLIVGCRENSKLFVYKLGK